MADVGLAPGLIGGRARGVSGWWSLLTSPAVAYDANHNVTTDSSGGPIVTTLWRPVYGGVGAGDYLYQYSGADPSWPQYYDVDPLSFFGPYGDVYTNNTDGRMINNDPDGISSTTAGTNLSQPYDEILIFRHNSPEPVKDSAGNPNRAQLKIFVTPTNLVRLYAGSTADWSVASTTLSRIFWIHWAGASSFIREHRSDGTDNYSGLMNPGTLGQDGLQLFDSGLSRVRIKGFAKAIGVDITQWNNLITWAQTKMSWS